MPKGRTILSGDTFDFNLGEGLAVTVFLAVALAALLVENDNFVALEVRHDAYFYARALDSWLTDTHLTIVVDEVYGVEGDVVAFSRCQPVDEDLLTLLNFKLLTGDGNNCKHC